MALVGALALDLSSGSCERSFFFCRSGFMANPFFAWWAWYLMVVGRGVGEDQLRVTPRIIA